jgi:hypothetical protein
VCERRKYTLDIGGLGRPSHRFVITHCGSISNHGSAKFALPLIGYQEDIEVARLLYSIVSLFVVEYA